MTQGRASIDVGRRGSGDGNQGREMAVAVTEFEGLDTPSTGVDSVADCAGTGAGESALAILFPRLVQRLESRRGEGIAGAIEALVEVVAARWCAVRSYLLEVPAQLVDRLGPEWRQQLVPDDLFRSLSDVREAAWAAEVNRRVAELDSGAVKTIPWAEVRRRLAVR